METEVGLGTAQEWYSESVELSDIEVSKFEELCGEMYKQKGIVGELKDRTKDENAILSSMKMKILAYLDKFEKDNYKSAFGTVYKIKKFSVKTVKEPEAKKELFAWLEEKGIGDKYITVDSRSINSLYKSMLESEGPDFVMPGTETPTYFEELGMRSK